MNMHMDGAGNTFWMKLQNDFYSTSNKVIWHKKKFKFHPRVKKCHFGHFSEWAGMAVPSMVSPQESLTGIENLFLPWVPMNI